MIQLGRLITGAGIFKRKTLAKKKRTHNFQSGKRKKKSDGVQNKKNI